MKKDEVFFGENGLTSTSANHIANMAKELYQQMEYQLHKINFLNKEVKLVANDSNTVLRNGIDEVQLKRIPETLNQISKLKSLIAWLREAIKARQNLMSELNRYSWDTYPLAKGKLERPICEPSMTEEDYIGGLSIKERNDYFYLETFCANVGKFIHNHGTFSDQRDELLDRVNDPYEIYGSGRDAMVYTYTPSVTPDKVDDVFFNLQNTHREYQARLNKMKHDMELAIEADTNAKMAKYRDAFEDYSLEVSKRSNEFADWYNKESQRIQALKIVIPDSLKSVYEMVNASVKK